jgi:hypothetical protein
MTQAFLMHMDRFDRRLELELARWLDPIVDLPAPRRRRRRALVALPAVTGGLTADPSDGPGRAPLAVVPIGTLVV